MLASSLKPALPNTKPQTGSCILNCASAIVVDLASTDTPDHVLVRLDVAGKPLLTGVTGHSAENFGIRPGLAPGSQIKAAALLA